MRARARACTRARGRPALSDAGATLAGMIELHVAGLKAPALVEFEPANELADETEPTVAIRLDDLTLVIGVDQAEQIADGIVEVLAERDTLPVWPRS